jgi:hypothetical protein
MKWLVGWFVFLCHDGQEGSAVRASEVGGGIDNTECFDVQYRTVQDRPVGSDEGVCLWDGGALLELIFRLTNA